MSIYKVSVTDDFPSEIAAIGRSRAGIFVDRVNGYEGELTDEQVSEIKEDCFLKLQEVRAPAEPKKAASK